MSAETSTPIVSIRGVSKYFGSIAALQDINIDIHPGEIFALLGPSGCGKSTLLRVISGFEFPTEGELLLDGEAMTDVPPNKRPINMVFQSYAVFPHMSVADNVAYGLKMENRPAAEIAERVSEALEQVHLSDLAQRMPDQLSGGQRQRVALARALIKKPRVLLLDEPLSALDAKLRDAMRLELVKLQETVGVTFVIVTHDQSEAMAMADRIAVLHSGRVRQIASPADLYQKPCDAFVADFIGNIHAFTVSAIEQLAHSLLITTDQLGQVELPQRELPMGIASGKLSAPYPVVAVRPEHIIVTAQAPPVNHIAIEGTLGDIAFQGQHSIVEVIVAGHESITAIATNDQAKALQNAAANGPVKACWSATDMLLLAHDATASVSS